MKIGIIIETNDAEKSWNAVRFANAALKRGHEARIFLMGAGVEIESITDEKHNAKAQIEAFAQAGGKVLACGSCIKARNGQGSDICPISTMNDCLDVVEWADKTLTF